MREVLVLRDLECIKAIAHPRRIDILKIFDEIPLSAKQLSQLLDEPHAKINYHIKTLYKVGILELVEEKIKSGIVEKYYYPSAKNIVIDKKVLDFSLHDKIKNAQEIYISKFEDIIELFYQAAEEDILEQGNIADYHKISLTYNELTELNKVINLKIKDILDKREELDSVIKYDLAVVSIPILTQKECNI